MRVDIEEIAAPNTEEHMASILDVDVALKNLGQHNGQALRVIELRFFGNFTVSEIAKILGVSESTALRHLRYALSELRSLL